MSEARLAEIREQLFTGYFHVRKEDVHAGSALKVDPPFAAFDVVLRQDYDGLAARVRELESALARSEERIRTLALLFGVPDGGRYLNDWKERAAALAAGGRSPGVAVGE